MSPLIKGASALAFSLNYKQLQKDGYPSKQAFAIAAGIANNHMKQVSAKRQSEIRRGKFFGEKTKDFDYDNVKRYWR